MSKKRLVFDLIGWFILSVADILSDSVDKAYQTGVALLWIVGSSCLLVLPLVSFRSNEDVMFALIWFAVLYFLFGLFYLLFKRCWE